MPDEGVSGKDICFQQLTFLACSRELPRMKEGREGGTETYRCCYMCGCPARPWVEKVVAGHPQEVI
jgi:hypothetical protein